MIRAGFADTQPAIRHNFEIERVGRGLWRVDDREGLIGGIFRTRKAFRFALFEADGDRGCVRLRRRARAASSLARANPP